MPTQEQYDVHQTSTRELYVKIDLLDFITENKIGEIQGNCTDGSINIDAFSNIRRTCDITLIVTDSSFLIGEDKKIWLNKKIRIFIGLKNILTDKIVWFIDDINGMGIFVIDSPTLTYSVTEKTLSFKGLDEMALLDGTIMGQLQNPTEIPVNLPISASIRSTVQTLGGINKCLIDDIGVNTPYIIKHNIGDSVFSVVKSLNDLYMNWESFFNESGYFVFQQIKNRVQDSIIWDFSVNRDLVVNYQIIPDFQLIKNRIVVWGRLLDNGTQIKSTLDNVNTNSPFNTTKLGIRPLPISDTNLFTQDQADMRALYELYKHSNFNEKVNISFISIYLLNVNKLVYFNRPEINMVGNYLITKLTIPLKYDSLMTMDAYKCY